MKKTQLKSPPVEIIISARNFSLMKMRLKPKSVLDQLNESIWLLRDEIQNLKNEIAIEKESRAETVERFKSLSVKHGLR
jgi:vacuolar-type H+-ATPase subunit I/STV1